MNKNPLITVIVPIYNVEAYLEQCIRSVLEQSYGEFELILVDDGSKDKSGQIVDQMAETDSRIVPLHQKNQGVAAARNAGLECSRGVYVAFLDGDDWYHPDFLRMMNAAMEDGACQLASCAFKAVGTEHPPQVKTLSAAIVNRQKAMQLLMGYNSFNGYVWNKLFDLQIIQNHHIRFQSNYPACEDTMFVGNYLLEYCLIMGGGVFINQFMLWYYARQAIGKPVFNLKRSLAHGKPMLILFIPVIAVSLYTMMDKLMLGAMSTKAQLGFYEAAEKIILCASSVITAFGTVMMPRMTKLFSDGNTRESQRYMKLSVEAVMASSFAISLGILSVSRLFAPIFWGKDFASCAYILSALALSIPFSGFANVIRMQYLIPNGMDRAYIISVILGAVSNLVANSLLISIYGALGAALGTVIAEGIVCIAQCFAVRKRISLQKYLNCIVPFGVAGLIMAAAVRVIDHVAIVTIPWLLIEIFVGSIVYCSLSLLYLYYTRNELLMAGIQKFSKR